jgi:hypothetical protein
MLLRVTLAAGLCLAMGIQGFSMSIKQFRDQQETTLVRIYLHGVGEGLGWANAELQSKDVPPIFCQPGNFELTADNYVRLVRTYLDNPPAPLKDDTPIELVLLEALQEAFPCKP